MVQHTIKIKDKELRKMLDGLLNYLNLETAETPDGIYIFREKTPYPKYLKQNPNRKEFEMENVPVYCQGLAVFRCPYCDRKGTKNFLFSEKSQKSKSDIHICHNCEQEFVVVITLTPIEVEVKQIKKNRLYGVLDETIERN